MSAPAPDPKVVGWSCASGDGTTGAAKIVEKEDRSFVGVQLSIGFPLTGAFATVLNPGEARKLAAEILNLADTAEGKTPLVFMPPGPTATYPPGHPSA